MSTDDEGPRGPQWQQGAERVTAHYSSINLHRKCPEAWYLRYSVGLSAPASGPAPEMNFGSWWGVLTGANALVRGRRADSLVVPPRRLRPVDGGPELDQATLTPKDVIEAASAWWGQQSAEVHEVWQDRMGRDLVTGLRATYARWMDEWGEAMKTERPMGLEVFWKRALPKPDDTKPGWDTSDETLKFGTGEPEVWLLGYIDQIYYDTERDLVVVRDDKSMKSMYGTGAESDMFDAQLQLYAWGVQPLLDKAGAGRVGAVAFDRVRSLPSTQPKLLQSGGLSKTVTEFDLRTYLEWVKGPDGEGQKYPGRAKDGSGAGVYQVEQEVVERITSPTHKAKFLQRTLTPVNRNVVRQHLRSAAYTSTDIWRTQKRAETSFEAPRNLSRDNCKWCEFKALCLAQIMGGSDGEYDLREMGLVSRTGQRVLAQGRLQDAPSQTTVLDLEDL